MKVKIVQFIELDQSKVPIKIEFYLNFLINKAEILTTSGDVSLKPCRKIDNVDLSDNSSAIFNAFNLSSAVSYTHLTLPTT